MLAEGVRGAFYFLFAPLKAFPVRLSDDNNEFTPRLLELKPTIQAFAKMGTELLAYEVADGRVRQVTGNAVANLYVGKTDAGQVRLMVASREVAKVQTVRVTVDLGQARVTAVKDFVDGSTFPVHYESGTAVCDVRLDAAAGRLLVPVLP